MINWKFLFLSLIFIILTVSISKNVYADLTSSSNEVITRVGNPVSNPGNNQIIQNAAQIGQTLRTSYDSGLGVNLYNVKTDEPGVYYWCTYIVVDSYNKAGFPELTRSGHGAVLTMKKFFATVGGKYKLLSADTSVEQLTPGDVVFFEGSGQHVSIIKSVDPGPVGDGFIYTLESNNVGIEDKITVVNHKAQKAQTTSGRYSITGFGRVEI